MTKVLHVITDTNIGGAGRYLLNLLSYGDPSRYEMEVACPGGGELQRQIEAQGVKVFELEGGEKSFRWSDIRQVRHIIAQGKFDIVHTHASLSGRIAGKVSGCQVVFTRHGVGHVNKGPVHRCAAKITTKMFTDAVIAVSRAVKVSMIEMGFPAGMIKTIHNGIDLSGYDEVMPTLRTSFGIPEGERIIGTVARLVPEKGCEYGIKAMPHILKEFPDTRLVIVGEGPLRPSLEELSRKLRVAHRVMFLGYQRDVEGLIADFDVFMMPSLTEGLSLALLEVMALGKPVVATEVGGNPEVIRSGSNGLLVPSEDEHALARAVGELISSRGQAHKMGMKAKETVVTNFNARLMARKTMDVYDEILRKAGKLQ
jgi:glycosyltransferase involved in cell wall biosynthesis